MGGCTVPGAGGRPDARLLLFPAGDVRILDTWQVAGLAGTGSHDIEVRDLFVPAELSASLISDPPREPGPLYAFPVFGLLAVGIASVALGIGRRAVEEITALAGEKTPVFGTRRLAERPPAQAQVAEAQGLVTAAERHLLDTVEETFERAAAQGRLDLGTRARVRIAATLAVQHCARAVDLVYHLGGGSSIYRTSPLQRLFRDVHVLTQHASVAPGTLELAGRVLLGVETDTSIL
jgi:alkylation response protein AidB-like acyl-CoA dehydrogenase